jgi:hypothetical protein
MRKALALALAVVIAAAMPALATGKTHAKDETFKGTVTAVDDSAKSFTVKGDDGKEMQFSWTDTTKGKPTANEMVVVHYKVNEGKDIATSVRAEKAHAGTGTGSAKSGTAK